jgi:hypothetical protein
MDQIVIIIYDKNIQSMQLLMVIIIIIDIIITIIMIILERRSRVSLLKGG